MSNDSNESFQLQLQFPNFLQNAVNEASLGPTHEVQVITTDKGKKMVVLKPVYLTNSHGDNLTVQESKAKLLKDLKLTDINTAKVTLKLKKGNEEHVMIDSDTITNYIKYFTDQFLIEINVNQH